MCVRACARAHTHTQKARTARACAHTHKRTQDKLSDSDALSPEKKMRKSMDRPSSMTFNPHGYACQILEKLSSAFGCSTFAEHLIYGCRSGPLVVVAQLFAGSDSFRFSHKESNFVVSERTALHQHCLREKVGIARMVQKSRHITCTTQVKE